MASVISVNLGVVRPNSGAARGVSGIDKRPASGAVPIRFPGPGPDGTGTVSGLVGDRILETDVHGGVDQAVYAYAREDLDAWAAELGRDLPGGVFGENLTTSGLDVTGALIGERWRVGGTVVLEVSVPRIPCRTFATWLAEEGWIKRFTEQAWPGAYLRVVTPGEVAAGDPIEVLDRPGHGVSIGLTFRALTIEPEHLPRLLDVDALPGYVKDKARRRLAPQAG